MKFHFPIIIIDEDFRSENASGLGIRALAEAIEKGEFERGIALCGSGEGMAITLNKHQRIRAGLVWRKEIAELVKKHNNANVIVLPARFITNDEAVEFIETYLTTEFEGGRHERRIAKIPVKGRE